MQKQLDVQTIVTRVQLVTRTLRQSEAYPAILGGVAGGIAGALMAVLIAGRIARRDTTREADASRESSPTTKEKPRFDLSVRELVQLVTILASLVKQIQAWARQR
ncbi:MAG: hypothetical protein N2559_00010 [Anaerolineae bacterium]|nr:hypothetical protein [Anaerolineae bacterium]